MSKSVEEIFVGAPEDATHYNQNNQMFYKFIGDAGMFWNDSRIEWLAASSKHNYPAMIERPQPKPWSGPEDGLPPVGTICELRTNRGGWGEAEIKYQGLRGICVWLWVRRDGNSEQVEWAKSPDKLEFRAIRTPEQIEAEKRETAIRELMDIAQVDCRVTAARLVDAGFTRKIIRSEENRSSAIESMKKVFDSVSDDLMPTSNKYLETLFGALCDAGFKREVV